MAITRPSVTANWADTLITDQINQDGNEVANRFAPPVEIQLSGLNPDEPMGRQWINHQFHLLNQWSMYEDEQRSSLESRIEILELVAFSKANGGVQIGDAVMTPDDVWSDVDGTEVYSLLTADGSSFSGATYPLLAEVYPSLVLPNLPTEDGSPFPYKIVADYVGV